MSEEHDIYVPGHSQCPQCNFYLVRTLVNPDLSVIIADESTTPNCPQCRTEMKSVTWKELVIQQAAINTVLYNKILDLTEAIEELKKRRD